MLVVLIITGVFVAIGVWIGWKGGEGLFDYVGYALIVGLAAGLFGGFIVESAVEPEWDIARVSELAPIDTNGNYIIQTNPLNGITKYTYSTVYGERITVDNRWNTGAIWGTTDIVEDDIATPQVMEARTKYFYWVMASGKRYRSFYVPRGTVITQDTTLPR